MLDAPVVRAPRRMPLGSRRAAAELPAPPSAANSRVGPRPRAAGRGQRGAGATRVAVRRADPRALEPGRGGSRRPEAHGAACSACRRRAARCSPAASTGCTRCCDAASRRSTASSAPCPTPSGWSPSRTSPGVALEDSSEIWCGRVLLVNAPRPALAAVVDQDPTPEILRALRPDAPAARRPPPHAPRGAPRGHVEAGDRRARPGRARWRGRTSSRCACLPERAPRRHGGPGRDLRRGRGRAPISARGKRRSKPSVADLMPFAGDALVRHAGPSPRWDCRSPGSRDPPAGGGWPATCDVRLSSRPPTWLLDRAGVGGLGFEGDVLLGWRAGDAVAAELA